MFGGDGITPDEVVPATTRRRQRSDSRKITGEVSSAVNSTHWNACSVHGTSSSHWAIGVPRRTTARTIVAELTHSQPPKRTLARPRAMPMPSWIIEW